MRRGTAYGVAAYLLWGLFPLYLPLLEPAGSVEILAHRIVWSLVVRRSSPGGHPATGRWIRPLLRDRPSLARLAVAAVLIAGNWVLYIWGVNNEHVVETSLGYFINPIVTVMLGVLVLHERLRPVQWAAIGARRGRRRRADRRLRPAAVDRAGAGVLVRDLRAAEEAGRRPGRRGAVAHRRDRGAVRCRRWPPGAAGGRAATASSGTPALGHALLLASAGVVTAVPLLLFAAAARRVPLSMLGLLQYLTPVLQFLTGVLVYDEPMPASRLAGFVLVWAALRRPVRGRAAPPPADPARRRRAGARRRRTTLTALLTSGRARTPRSRTCRCPRTGMGASRSAPRPRRASLPRRSSSR